MVQKAKKEVHQNKGGVCFDIDVKQFTAPVAAKYQEKPLVQKKKKKEDVRMEVIRRREAAKAYDRLARRALFSPPF